MTVKHKGYLWKFHGFTMTHMWGLHLVSALLTIVGVGMLTFAILRMNQMSAELFYKLIAASTAVMITDIATILYSIFTIMFYRHAAHIEDAKGKD